VVAYNTSSLFLFFYPTIFVFNIFVMTSRPSNIRPPHFQELFREVKSEHKHIFLVKIKFVQKYVQANTLAGGRQSGIIIQAL